MLLQSAPSSSRFPAIDRLAEAWSVDALGSVDVSLDLTNPTTVAALLAAGYLVEDAGAGVVRASPVGRQRVDVERAATWVDRHGPDEAMRRLDVCATAAPWDAGIALAKAVLLASSGREREARVELGAALERFPHDEDLVRFAGSRGLPSPPLRARERLEGWLMEQATSLMGPILEIGTSPGQRTWEEAIGRRETVDSSEAVYDDGQERPDHVADVQDLLGIADGSFGSVVCTEVLEHVRRPDRAAEALLRVTRRGGVALVSVPALYHFHPCPLDLRRFTHQGLSELMKDAGWTVEQVGGVPMPREAHVHVIEAVRILRGRRPSPPEAERLLGFSNFWVRARKA